LKKKKGFGREKEGHKHRPHFKAQDNAGGRRGGERGKETQSVKWGRERGGACLETRVGQFQREKKGEYPETMIIDRGKRFEFSMGTRERRRSVKRLRRVGRGERGLVRKKRECQGNAGVGEKQANEVGERGEIE